MSEPLVTYLDDHLGGAQIATELLEAMRDQHDNQRFREFASSLLPEIEADDRTLRSVAETIGAGPNVANKSAAGFWKK
jgi:N-acetylglucosamine kinase-like BadF-type ATPase